MRGILQLAHDFIFGSEPAAQPPAERYDDLSTLQKLNILMASPNVPPAQKQRLSAIAMQGWNWQGGLINQWTGEKFYGAMGYPPIVHRNPTLERRRSRIAWLESVQARELLQRLVDNVIGPGLKLESTPKWEIIQPSLEIASEVLDSQRRAKEREIQIRFDLFMGSKDPDITGRKNGYQLQRLFFLNYLRDGEVFILFRYSPDPRRISPLTVQFIGPDQILNPHDTTMYTAAEARGNRIVEGIELDADNNEVAYFIFDEKVGTSTRVSKYGPKSRRVFMVHALIQEAIGQVRGTPVLSSVVHELQKITDYGVAELESAVVNAMFATWVKPAPDKRASDILRGLTIASTSAMQAATAPVPSGADPRVEPPQLGMAIQPGLVSTNLGPGEEIVSFDSKRPNVAFGGFVDTIMKAVASSTGQPLEVVEMRFNANYSASRAAMLLAWNVVDTYVDGVASDFLNPLFEQWFTEEIRAGNIKLGDFGGAWDSSPVLRRAWLSCDWIGVPMPAMDPAAEAKADDIRIQGGLTTRERVGTQAQRIGRRREHAPAQDRERRAERGERLACCSPARGQDGEGRQPARIGAEAGSGETPPAGGDEGRAA